MKKFLFALLIASVSISSFSATSKNKEKEKVEKGSASAAIVYSLPKTVLLVQLTVAENKHKVGPYYRYAERYLGVTDVVTEDKTTYEITAVKVSRRGDADSENTFEAVNGGMVSLSKRGVIRGVNIAPDAHLKKMDHPKKKPEETTFLANSVLTEDQLVANSVAKMAENAAKQIYRIRESRINLITGDNEKYPADGESMKMILDKLDESEKALVELFVGTITPQIKVEEIEITPKKNMNNEILCRLSSLSGIVDKDDLSGRPIYINLNIAKNTIPAVRVSKKKGYFYILPAQAAVVIFTDDKEFYKNELEISEFGSLQQIPAKSLKSKCVKLTYNDKTGALISIEQ